MKQNIFNIFKIALFFCIFIILYSFLTYLKKPSSVDLDNISGFYAEKENSLDVMYIGGSASFVFYEPLVAYQNYGIASYLFSANAIQAELYEFMLKEIYTKQDPKLIVIDARAFEYRDRKPPSSVSYRNVLTGIPLNKNKYNFIKENVPKYINDTTESYYFDLKIYHTNQEIPSAKKAVKMMINKNNNSLKGFYFVPKALNVQKFDSTTSKVKKPPKETINILNSLINYLKTKDAKVLFVVSPYVETKGEKQIFNYVENTVEDAGFDFLDANEYVSEMNLNYKTDFYDFNHVNIYGADKYTEFLSKYIKDNYDIKDRRNDKNYSKWNGLLENWHAKEKSTKEKIDKIINRKGYYEEIYIKE